MRLPHLYYEKSMNTNFQDSPHPMCYDDDKVHHMWSTPPHIIDNVWELISQSFSIWWVLLLFPMQWEIDEKTHAFRIPAKTQRWFNVDIFWNKVATSVNVISTLIHFRFVNVDSTIKFNVETTLNLGWLLKQFCSHIIML